jgi:hypothetical protein
MPDIAFFATEKPIPGQSYTGFPIAGRNIFVRVAAVDGLAEAVDLCRPDETLLNTYEDIGESSD